MVHSMNFYVRINQYASTYMRTPEAPLYAQDDWLKMHIIQHNKTLVATTTVSQRFITAMFQHNIGDLSLRSTNTAIRNSHEHEWRVCSTNAKYNSWLITILFNLQFTRSVIDQSGVTGCATSSRSFHPFLLPTRCYLAQTSWWNQTTNQPADDPLLCKMWTHIFCQAPILCQTIEQSAKVFYPALLLPAVPTLPADPMWCQICESLNKYFYHQAPTSWLRYIIRMSNNIYQTLASRKGSL